MDRPALDAVVARLDALSGVRGGAPLAAWQDAWRLVGGDGAPSPPATVAACAEAIDKALARPGRRLVAYGTLRPGEPNHALVAGLGRWERAFVRGHLGDWQGYPILRPAPDGPEVAVMLLTSDRLPPRMADLDAFEGPAYRRAWVVAELDGSGGPGARSAVAACCYVDARR
jgi:gamma-glutamylcyclotransferase (GGCT)/AIG2-like uncharacterized protein YtfP